MFESSELLIVDIADVRPRVFDGLLVNARLRFEKYSVTATLLSLRNDLSTDKTLAWSFQAHESLASIFSNRELCQSRFEIARSRRVERQRTHSLMLNGVVIFIQEKGYFRSVLLGFVEFFFGVTVISIRLM